MALTDDDVRKIARLARITVSEDDLQPMAGELGSILTLVETLSGIDTADVAPMTSVDQRTQPLRPDAVTDGDMPERVLSNAPEKTAGFYVVPKVIE